jgi:hypothetical protein
MLCMQDRAEKLKFAIALCDADIAAHSLQLNSMPTEEGVPPVDTPVDTPGAAAGVAASESGAHSTAGIQNESIMMRSSDMDHDAHPLTPAPFENPATAAHSTLHGTANVSSHSRAYMPVGDPFAVATECEGGSMDAFSVAAVHGERALLNLDEVQRAQRHLESEGLHVHGGMRMAAEMQEQLGAGGGLGNLWMDAAEKIKQFLLAHSEGPVRFLESFFSRTFLTF